MIMVPVIIQLPAGLVLEPGSIFRLGLQAEHQGLRPIWLSKKRPGFNTRISHPTLQKGTSVQQYPKALARQIIMFIKGFCQNVKEKEERGKEKEEMGKKMRKEEVKG
jgi:hypothetical protein